MAFRTIVISTNSKLELSLNYLIHRTVDKTTKILLSEIHTLIIQSTQVAITTALICELNKYKIKVIFCDEKANPDSEIIPYYSNHFSSKNIELQIKWNKNISDLFWAEIIRQKIINQSKTLSKCNLKDKSFEVLDFSTEIVPGDITNREGHAAKVYFNALFGMGFSRQEDNNINSMLNYAYSILLSFINREIVSYGYLTQIGIHHHNDNNFFNLGCDLMEPFRPIVDFKVKNIVFSGKWKDDVIDIFSSYIFIDNKKQTFYNAVKIYIESFFKAINLADVTKLIFCDDYDI